MNDMRQFPIQGGMRGEKPFGNCDVSKVPWWLAEIAYAHYASLFGTQQSLERLAERGGFGREEFVLLLRGENPCEQKLDLTNPA